MSGSQKIRVRQLLDELKGTGRKALLKYIPTPNITFDSKGVFPNALMTALPSAERYSITGLLTEMLVLLDAPLSEDFVVDGLTALGITLEEVSVQKINKSKTTKEYIAKIQKTKEELQKHVCLSSLAQNQVITYQNLEGHPDGIEGKTVLEVKTTSNLEENLPYFMLQLFSYVAIGDYTKAILVLPLQQSILTFNTTEWKEKVIFRDVLVSKAKKFLETPGASEIDPFTLMEAKMMVQLYGIGTHTAKAKTLLETVQGMVPRIPYQIFLCSNQSTHISVKDSDLALASSHVEKNNINLYIHSPYIINLSAKTDGDWNLICLQKLLQHTAVLGAKGVVVHTGKHTKESYEEGVKKMRSSIEAILPFAKPECPLLLETPAGQGTETLQGQDEFLDFVESFKSPNIAVCLDTCHVFANGHDPLTYIHKAFERGLLRLVHYNDSQDCCGSCKDRHAFVGTGKIGLDKMTDIALFCTEKKIPMVIE
jgi:endonuclease IV